MNGEEFVNQLNARIAELGLSKAAFTELTGISRSSVSQWKTGISKPSDDAIRKINSVLGTNFEVSLKTDNIFDKIQMLQELRDSERALLAVTKNMTDDEIRRTTEFIKSLKGDV